MNITETDLEAIFKNAWIRGYRAHREGVDCGNYESGGWEADWKEIQAMYAPIFAMDASIFQLGVITPRQKELSDAE